MVGLTFGHAIYIRQDQQSPRLLVHECRHVYQHEHMDGIPEFLSVYLAQVLACGYEQAPF